MNKESKPLKPFAKTEREELRDNFARRAGEAPIPNPFDAESMREWEQYREEMVIGTNDALIDVNSVA